MSLKVCSGAEMKRECGSGAFWRDVLVEFIGTFFLVSVQCMVPLNMAEPAAVGRDAVDIALAMGFIVLVLVDTFASMGGANFNPAVTVGLLFSNKMTLLRGAMYIIAQVGGGLTGGALVYGVTPAAYRAGLSGTFIADSVTWWQGLIVEAWLTAILMLAVLGSTNADRRQVYMPAVTIGLAIALDIMTGIRYTGASMNPARSLPPAVFVGREYPVLWDHQYIYWAGPILGSSLASVLYTHILNHPKVQNTEKHHNSRL